MGYNMPIQGYVKGLLPAKIPHEYRYFVTVTLKRFWKKSFFLFNNKKIQLYVWEKI